MNVCLRNLLRAVGPLLICGSSLCAAEPNAVETEAEQEFNLPRVVEFNRDIRPILSDICYNCHGPDPRARAAELRFDIEEIAKGELPSGNHAIVPGEPTLSELVRRLKPSNPDDQMPPADFGRQLSARQVLLLTRWIQQGAKWQGHWSFIPPKRPVAPPVRAEARVENAIDRFVLAKLEAAGLTLSAEASREKLVRRVTLDLTGLPPTPDEVEAFLKDDSPQAYQRVVDRLLASPHYGERMAMGWLDAARYADTSGYQTDGVRHQWRWRDWVIDAFNKNQPFDAFTVEQIAGDLLPNATLSQKIATGFNRNHRTNSEGGIVPEEYQVEYVVDRVDTTSTVWLGLTVGCARCHDHKYDPITQKDFYRLFALFNNIPERGRVIKYGNSRPVVKSPTPRMAKRLARLQAKLDQAEARFKKLRPAIQTARETWLTEFRPTKPMDWTVTEALMAHLPLDGSLKQTVKQSKKKRVKKEDAGKETTNALGMRRGTAQYTKSQFGQALRLSDGAWANAARVPSFGGEKKVSIGLWVRPEGSSQAALFTLMNDNDARDNGLALSSVGNRLTINFGPRWLDDAIRVESEEEVLAAGVWRHVMLTYDGSQSAAGLKLYVDGQLQKTNVLLDNFTGTFTTSTLLRLGSAGGNDETFVGALDAFRFYERELSQEEVQILASPTRVDQSLRQADRRLVQTVQLAAYFLAEAAPPEQRAAYQAVRNARRAVKSFRETIPTTMVMRERPRGTETHLLLRGEYDKPGEKVTPGVPECFEPLPSDAPANRLSFANWLVDPRNPLVARVAVNRYWQRYFGMGLVRTVEDFGAQGDWPTHPGLLDYLATEFVRSGWDVKAMQKLIVTSATYRQDSQVTEQHKAIDPENKLLARAARLRLPAEMIRDQALACGGLLVEKVGGPSVKPYQPAGLWKEITNERYVQEHGEALYRRGMYTFWKRTVPPPTMTTFDATSREACTLSRSRTNTPLQALALLNEVTFVEAARNLAERVLEREPLSAEARLQFMHRLVLARRADARELKLLVSAQKKYLAHYQQDPPAALKLISVGESARNSRLPPAELAAYTAVANLLLNLDEAITRE